MEFNFHDRKKEEKNHMDSSRVGAGSSKTPPFGKKEVGSAGATNPQIDQDGKFLVRLMMPKPSEEKGKEGFGEAAEEIEKGLKGETTNFGDKSPCDAINNEFSHLCKECNKDFSSGKALGGHMSSAHVQAKGHMKKLKMRRYEDSLNEGYDSELEKQICKICDKEFPSTKSLYGHMRLHPEREWRGMEPPAFKGPLKLKAPWVVDDDQDYHAVDDPNENLENFKESKESAKESVVDLTDFLMSRWGVTGKRGRPTRQKHEMEELYPFADEEKQQVYDVAHQLLSLVNGDNFKAESPQQLEVPSENSSSPSVEIINSIDFPSKKIKFNQIVDCSSDDDVCEETLDGTTVPFDSSAYQKFDSSKIKNAAGKRRRKSEETTHVGQKVEMQIQEVTSSESEDRKCNTYRKIFPSHKALGGNRSSNNKVKVSVQNTFGNAGNGNQANSVARLFQLNNEIVGGDTWKESENVHYCNICGKTFTSSQALGGHKRIHFIGSSSSRVAASSDEGGSKKSERKFLDFDLNVTPDEDS